MKITRETINGVEHTVVLYGIGTAPVWARVYENWTYQDNKYDGCILPPLPKHPTKKDARLFHLYAAHGLYVQGTCDMFKIAESDYPCDFLLIAHRVRADYKVTITHCFTDSGERVEVAIIDNKEA